MLSWVLLMLSTGHPAVQSNQECAVLAAVAREQFFLDRELAPPLEPAGDYLPDCDWQALGLKGFAAKAEWPRGKLIFHRPIVRGRRASVAVLIIYGVRSGEGLDCNLRSRGGEWKLVNCSRRIAL